MKIDRYKKLAEAHKEEFALFRDSFFPVVMKWEGGEKLHKIKNDRGGWTKWGIAYNFWYMLFSDFNDFKDTTRDEAAYFAFAKFYLPIRADLMQRDSKLFYFDMAYNMGTNRAIKIMQACAGVKQDGRIGPITRSRMYFVTEDCLQYKRNQFYCRLAEKRYKLRKFLKGWLNRSTAIFNYNY